MSRSKKSVKNIKYALIGQLLGLIISFIARIVFIRILGSEYLGLNGLFSNILVMLSLAELGVGEAITFSLYEPLAKNNKKKCKALMQIYKKVYTIIGIIILIIGICITPILPFLIKEMPNIKNINLIYILFVVNTSISYFFSYKRNLIIADQNRYIATFYRYSFYIVLNILQVIFLIITKNYIIFLLLQVMNTLLENIFVSRKANKIYPYLLEKDIVSLDNKSKKKIVKNTKAMMMHKIGGIVVTSTDNIILSKFVGLTAVGLYSNYFLILNALNIIFSQIYSSIVASVGNLFAVTNKEKQFEIFEKIDFLGFWIYCFSSVCLLCLFNPFITIWIGKKYLFNINIVLILVINFYITGMRKSNLTFREASGLFYKDRWKAVVEAIINLVASIILAIKFGVFGVFFGTFISSITTCVWVEPYVLFKYGFNKKLSIYFKKYFYYLFITIFISIITYYLCSLINGNAYIMFFIKTIICLIIPNSILIIIFKNDNNFKYYCSFVKNLISKRKIS